MLTPIMNTVTVIVAGAAIVLGTLAVQNEVAQVKSQTEVQIESKAKDDIYTRAEKFDNFVRQASDRTGVSMKRILEGHFSVEGFKGTTPISELRSIYSWGTGPSNWDDKSYKGTVDSVANYARDYNSK